MERLIILNWKTYIKSAGEAVTLAHTLPDNSKDHIVVCPSALHLAAVGPILQGKGVALGAQDIAASSEKVQTGRSSGEQLRSAGVSHCLVGHPETRRLGVTDEMVAEKVRQALSHNIKPIICFTALQQVVTMCEIFCKTSEHSALTGSIFAYEPEEYIGKTEAMPVEQLRIFWERAQAMLDAININEYKLLYGGSVNDSNIQGILSVGVDGFLVGSASVDPERLDALLSAISEMSTSTTTEPTDGKPAVTRRFDHTKYKPFQPIDLKDRIWPNQTITKAPQWCSVDLRDGNQALIDPMSVEQKKKFWSLLVDVGFKEIEVGFPSASQIDFDFVRHLIEKDRIPEDVTIQVITQARPELIQRTFEALKGARRVIIHLYNSTSVVQREKVFKTDKAGILNIAVTGAKEIKRCAEQAPETEWVFQYSPESFTGTEVEFALEISEALSEVWQPTPEHPCIMNLPATVEMSTPNVYADQIELFCRTVPNRDSLIIGLHTHNDRGCAVAAAELGVMAGGQRVEGTLLGNGERTGNMDIVVMAMNLYSQGIDPGLDFSDMDRIVSVVRECTKIDVHPRQAYSGDLVFTAFSGSHQDAIKKCLDCYKEGEPWEIAYLPIDPRDLGRTYQDVIRVNSQSGKGGVAYVLAESFGFHLPRWLQIDFSRVVQKASEKTGEEISPDRLWELFSQQYLRNEKCMQLEDFTTKKYEEQEHLDAQITYLGKEMRIAGVGTGVLSAFVDALKALLKSELDVIEYETHALGHGIDAEAVTYIQISCEQERYIGVAVNRDVVTSSLEALIGAITHMLREQQAKT